MWVVSVIPAQAGIHAAKAGSLPRRALGPGVQGEEKLGEASVFIGFRTGRESGVTQEAYHHFLPLRPGEAPAEQREPDVGFAVQVMKRRLPVESDEALLRIDSETDGVRVDRGRGGEVQGNEREEKPRVRSFARASIDAGYH